jgi:hypothetical protein
VTPPAGDEVLDAALRIVLARTGHRPSEVFRPLGRDLRRTLYERLAAAGAVRAERARAVGVFPVRRWPTQDASHAAQVRRLVTQALIQQAAPDPGSAALIALVHALKCEQKIVDPRLSGLSRRQLRARLRRSPRAAGPRKPSARCRSVSGPGVLKRPPGSSGGITNQIAPLATSAPYLGRPSTMF